MKGAMAPRSYLPGSRSKSSRHGVSNGARDPGPLGALAAQQHGRTHQGESVGQPCFADPELLAGRLARRCRRLGGVATIAAGSLPTQRASDRTAEFISRCLAGGR